MKKLFTLGLAAALAPAASADTLYGIYVGGGNWKSSFSGDVADAGASISVSELNLDELSSPMFWVHLEHPIPLLPNLRLMRTDSATSAMSTTTRQIQFGGVSIAAEVDVLTEMDVSHTDATLYYELLDNWVSLDLGLTARYFDGYVDVQSELTEPARSELKGVLPMAYVNAQVELPFSNVQLGAYANGVKYDGDGIVDIAAYAGYYFDVTPLLDIGFNLGYRRMDIDAKNFDELYADITADGAYAELFIHF